MTSRAGAVALAAYDTEPRGTRLHVRGRWRSCPMEEVEAVLPREGRVLDLGCGHGVFALFVALAAPEREVTGVDVDEDKITIARRAAPRLATDDSTRPSFEVVEPDWMPPAGDTWDAIVINDVLYLLGRDRALALVAASARALAPGGVLAVKEIDTQPRWKYEWARLQELVATRVARVTEGEHVAFVPPDDIAAAMEAEGLTVSRRRLDAGRLHPHLLVLGRNGDR